MISPGGTQVNRCGAASTQHTELLAALSARYTEVLDSPPERIRAYLTLHRPEHRLTGGAPGVDAPYFTALVLEGRPGGDGGPRQNGAGRRVRRSAGENALLAAGV